jgi:hypothetical protein
VTIDIENVGTATAREPFVVVNLEPQGFGRAWGDGGIWRLIGLRDVNGFKSDLPIHPDATHPQLTIDFPKGTVDPAAWAQISAMIYIYSFDAERQKFFAVLDVGTMRSAGKYATHVT